MSGGYPVFGQICAGNDQGTDTANSRGTAVVAGNSAYGSYTQLVASTSQDTTWVTLGVQTNGSANTANEFKVKLAVGAAASEVTLISDIPFQCGSSAVHGYNYTFPLSVPAGSRIAAAAYQTGHTDTGYVYVILWDGGYPDVGAGGGYDVIGSSGDHGTSITYGAANTKGSYSQLVASTSNDYNGFFVVLDAVGTASSPAQTLVDIAIGAAASEVVILPNLFFEGGTIGLASHFYPIAIPAGTRIAARAQCPAGSGSLGVSLQGMR